MNKLERSISSLEIAEMVGRQHNDVLKDTRRIIEQLDEGKSSLISNFFIESTYTDGANRQKPCFMLTKKGCELFGTRMTGEKGTQFAVAYIERFNEMEQHIKQKIPQNSLELALRAALEHEQSIKEIRTDVDYLKDNMRIDSLQQQEIQKTANQSVTHALGGKESIAYKNISKKAFSAFWNEFKQYFKVPRYGDIQKIKQEEALRFIKLWHPSTSLQMEIDNDNSQMSFE